MSEQSSFKLQNNILSVSVDTRIYPQDVITAACYKFTGEYYITQQGSSSCDTITHISFERKDGKSPDELDARQFNNELIDQSIRHKVNLQFGHIRDLIVEEAFKPVNR